MAKVYNRHHGDAPSSAVYIGRGSPYGNPFVIGVDGTRADVIEKYRAHLLENKELLDRVQRELKGVDLLCSCKPAACHGDVLLSLANPEEHDPLAGSLFA